MSGITVEFEAEDWVWLCEFLSQVIREGELDKYTEEDTKRLLSLLQAAEDGR